MVKGRWSTLLLAATVGFTINAAGAADLTVGLNLPQTGPGSSFGVPMMNAVSLMPPTIGGLKVNYVALDSRTDVTQTAANTRKLISENKADVLIGEAVQPTSLAMVPIAGEAKTPLLATSAIKSLAYPVDDIRRWVFKIVP